MLLVRVLAIWVMIVTPAFAQKSKSGKPKPLEVTLKGKFVPAKEDGAKPVFKAGGKTYEIDLNKVALQKHRVEKLVDLKPGTVMAVFSHYKEWSDGDEFEAMACLLAGDVSKLPRPKEVEGYKPRWRFGRLSFNDNNTIAYVDRATLPTGVGRAVCIIEKARIGEFFNFKGGKRKPKPAYMRAAVSTTRIDGKKKTVLVPRVITLPTRGIPSKEYKYILDPAKMYLDLRGG